MGQRVAVAISREDADTFGALLPIHFASAADTAKLTPTAPHDITLHELRVEAFFPADA